VGEGSGYAPKWDHRGGQLIFYRDIYAQAAPAVRIGATAGKEVLIYPMRDLPEAQRMTIWDVAEAPDGSVVFSVIAEYGPREVKPVPVKSLLLTYDQTGTLTRLWDVYPYHHHNIAVDGAGNVFGFGSKDTRSTIYPLIVKYSPSGRVLSEFLSADQLSVGDMAVESGSENGESELFIDGDELILWSARTQEILKFTLSGELHSRISLKSALKSVAVQNGSGRTKVLKLSPGPSNITAQLQLWPAPDSNSGEGVKLAMATFENDGGSARLASAGTQSSASGRFLGRMPDGKLVFMEQSSKAKEVEIHTY
jgi:hypothetical protein